MCHQKSNYMQGISVYLSTGMSAQQAQLSLLPLATGTALPAASRVSSGHSDFGRFPLHPSLPCLGSVPTAIHGAGMGSAGGLC